MKDPSVQDFSLVQQFVNRAKTDQGLTSDSQGYYYVLLGTLFGLQDDEIDQSITRRQLRRVEREQSRA